MFDIRVSCVYFQYLVLHCNSDVRFVTEVSCLCCLLYIMYVFAWNTICNKMRKICLFMMNILLNYIEAHR